MHQNESQKFSQYASSWWEPDGQIGPLHYINPLRLAYIQRFISNKQFASNKQSPPNKQFIPHKPAAFKILDLGCGAGILTEAMARQGWGEIHGLDGSPELIAVAKQRQEQQAGLANLTYAVVNFDDPDALRTTVEPLSYDLITIMEVVEHLNDPSQILEFATQSLKPGGHLIISTINRNSLAYLSLILGAEYLLKLIPRGTHQYYKFIKPSELSELLWQQQLEVLDIQGYSYNPLTKTASFSRKPKVNYFICAQK